MAAQLRLHISLLTLWYFCCEILGAAASSGSGLLAKPDCPSLCGKITIPFPFGIQENCFSNRDFHILCDNSTNPPKAFLNLTDSRPEVLEISLEGTLKVTNPITFSNCTDKINDLQAPDLTGTPFWYSQKNSFSSMSCGGIAFMTSLINGTSNTSAGCLSICSDSGMVANNSCGGVNCCQTTIPSSLGTYNTTFRDVAEANRGKTLCKSAFLVDQDWFTSNSTNISSIRQMSHVPVMLEWRISSPNVSGINFTCENVTRTCSCSKGFTGNPYLDDGCIDINECLDPNPSSICASGTCINQPGGFRCQLPNPQPVKLSIIVPCTVFGVLFLIVGAWWLYKVVKKRESTERKQKFFRQNGGLLLEQQLSSGEVNVEKIKLFNAKELEKATDRFNVDRILGEGGQGTVYKGMLTDGRIVAVKKSKIADGGEVGQFINEIVILSQINHRNVVKILGCCLEIEVPLLVYEFLPNGTLSHYIHGHDEEFPLTWKMRLRIAIEVSGALSYLHSSASMPIYHRDIKSSNILLDEKHRAKIADFGTSRSVAIDQTHLTMTHVNGTFGYLDPEYFQSSQFTDKSDVYSFGVVLAELLTGKKPVSITRLQDGRQEGRSLATYFIVSMDDSRLFDILDAGVVKEGRKEDIMAVANLAKRCLNMKGKKRPTMKEVAAELEGIVLLVKSSDVDQNVEEVEYVRTEIVEAWDAVSRSTGSHMDTSTSSSFDVQPLLAFRS